MEARELPLIAVAMAAAILACDGRSAPEAEFSADSAADSAAADTLTTTEQREFAIDLERYPEMREGRLDTVDMIGETADAAWHIQAVNYAPQFIAMTYAAWYTGPDSTVAFAADGQPHLEDEMGNIYHGIVIPINPRFRVASGTTAVGVYVFRPALAAEADSLTLFVNDLTAPVLRIGPFSAHQADGGSLSPVDRAPETGLGIESAGSR